ncbi:MAG TPA: tetratricopeptide repeat protein, partial [Flavobacteriales bacterium]|nr:tetratricopeptide repeat protein [Flavobacteriales bacterium]
QQGDLTGAVASYRRAIAIDPEHAGAHFNLGSALQQQGDLTGAVASYRRAIAIDPEDADAHLNLGSALQQQGDLTGAVVSLWTAITLDPQEATAFAQLGLVHLSAGNYNGAMIVLKQALAFRTLSTQQAELVRRKLEEAKYALTRAWAGTEPFASQFCAAVPEGADKCCVCCAKPGSSSRCSKCSAVLYCGRECQVQHWKTHKKSCAAVKPKVLVTLKERCHMPGPAQ